MFGQIVLNMDQSFPLFGETGQSEGKRGFDLLVFLCTPGQVNLVEESNALPVCLE